MFKDFEGAQWRKNALEYTPDTLFQFGLLSGQGGPTPPVACIIETTGLFIEASIPLVTGMEFAERLAINRGYRRSDDFTSDSYSTRKLVGDWQIVPEHRIRGAWQRVARAPNVIELFAPQAIGLTTLATLAKFETDPCAGAVPTATLAQCMNTGVMAGRYGAIVSNPAGHCNALFDGNPTLNPEISDT